MLILAVITCSVSAYNIELNTSWRYCTCHTFQTKIPIFYNINLIWLSRAYCCHHGVQYQKLHIKWKENVKLDYYKGNEMTQCLDQGAYHKLHPRLRSYLSISPALYIYVIQIDKHEALYRLLDIVTQSPNITCSGKTYIYLMII